MDNGLRRLAGAAVMAAGIALACWLAFGASQDGEARPLRMALGLGSTAVITGGARLMFREPSGGRDRTGRG
ncbi:hypothetical protein [Streptomyces kronopolitis]|uniref:hypothetical protein n=1 Tax=Streptomyces kronopolitis TaxID=1612435 RepID=UPI00342E84E8